MHFCEYVECINARFKLHFCEYVKCIIVNWVSALMRVCKVHFCEQCAYICELNGKVWIKFVMNSQSGALFFVGSLICKSFNGLFA